MPGPFHLALRLRSRSQPPPSSEEDSDLSSSSSPDRDCVHGDVAFRITVPSSSAKIASVSPVKVGRKNANRNSVSVNGSSHLTLDVENPKPNRGALKLNRTVSKPILANNRVSLDQAVPATVAKGVVRYDKEYPLNHTVTTSRRHLSPQSPSVQHQSNPTFIRRVTSMLSIHLPHPTHSQHATQLHPRADDHIQPHTALSSPTHPARPPRKPRHSPAVQAALRERGLLGPAKDLSEQEREIDAKLDLLAKAKPQSGNERENEAESSAAWKIKQDWEARNRDVYERSSAPIHDNSNNEFVTGSSRCGTYPAQLATPNLSRLQTSTGGPDTGTYPPPPLVEQVPLSDVTSSLPSEQEEDGAIGTVGFVPDIPPAAITSPTGHEPDLRTEENPSQATPLSETHTGLVPQLQGDDMKFASMFSRRTSRSNSRSTPSSLPEPPPSQPSSPRIGALQARRSTYHEYSDKDSLPPVPCLSASETIGDDSASPPPSPFAASTPISYGLGNTLSDGHGQGQGHTSWLKAQDCMLDRPPIIVESPVEDSFVIQRGSDEYASHFPPMILESPVEDEFGIPEEDVTGQEDSSHPNLYPSPTGNTHRTTHLQPLRRSTANPTTYNSTQKLLPLEPRRRVTALDEGENGNGLKRGRRSLAKITTTSLSNMRRSFVDSVSAGKSLVSSVAVPRLPPSSTGLAPGYQGGAAVRRSALSPTMHSRGTIVVEARGISDDESRRLSELAFLS